MFKLMSINLDGYSDEYGAWPIRIGMIREMIEDACPDVIALQSVAQAAPTSFEEDQASQIAALSKVFPQVLYQKNGENGLAIIARDLFKPLPGEGEDENRGWLGARFDVGGFQFDLATATQFQPSPGAEGEAAASLADFISKGECALLVGCLGKRPLPRVSASLQHAHWYDVWQELYPGEFGHTSGPSEAWSDTVWASPWMRPFVHSLKRVAGGPFTSAARPASHASLLLTLSGIESEPT